jgi:hypothetical protein
VNKKILSLIIFSAFLAFFPVAKICATPSYVGVEITHGTSAPGTNGNADTSWCLPTGDIYSSNRRTEMVIMSADASSADSCSNSSASQYITHDVWPHDICSYCSESGECISPDTNSLNAVKYLNTPTCAGSTIYSPLLDLDANTVYRAYIVVPNFCPGYQNGSFCYVAGKVGENCCDACNDYNLTAKGGETDCANSTNCSSPVNSSDIYCQAESTLMGGTCSNCAWGSDYNWYNLTDKTCSTTDDGSYINKTVSCSEVLPSPTRRACTCNAPSASNPFGINSYYAGVASFLFSFTTPNPF